MNFGGKLPVTPEEAELHQVRNFTAERGEMTLHRARFMEALMPLLDEGTTKVYFEKRCVDIGYLAAEDTYRVEFADGTRVEADMVVGADGVRSVVREVVGRGWGEGTGDATAHSSTASSASESPAAAFDGPRASTSRSNLEYTSHPDADPQLSYTGSKVYRALVPYEKLVQAGVKLDLQRLLVIVGLQHVCPILLL